MSPVTVVFAYISDHPEVILIAIGVVFFLLALLWWIYRPVTWREGEGPVIHGRGDTDPNIPLFNLIDWLLRR